MRRQPGARNCAPLTPVLLTPKPANKGPSMLQSQRTYPSPTREGNLDMFRDEVVSVGITYDRRLATELAAYRRHEISMVEESVVQTALQADKASAKVMAKGLRPQAGDLCGVRLNLNVQNSQGAPVQTLHAGNRSGGYKLNRGLYNGATLWYQRVVVLRDAYFNVSQRGREKIASGAESKFPMASIDGLLVDDEAPSFDGIEIRFQPKEVHPFVDMDNRPIRWAEEVTIYGHRAYARGQIEYYTAENAPKREGHSESLVQFQI